MDKLLEILAQNGPFAVMCGVLLWLLVRVLKRLDALIRAQLKVQVADTAAKSKLTEALEDVVETVEILSSRDISDCRASIDALTKRVDKYIECHKIERAREEGRLEASTPRIKAIGEDDESRRR